MRETAKSFVFWLAAIFLWEVIFQQLVFGQTAYVGLLLSFSCAAAPLMAALSALPGRIGRAVGWLLPAVLSLVYGVQLVYHDIFGSLLSLAYVSMGGEALVNFWPIAMGGIRRCLPGLLILALPAVGLWLLRWRGLKAAHRPRELLVLLGLCAALALGTVKALPLFGREANSHYAVYHSASATVDRWAERFGLLAADAMDLRRLAFGRGGVRAGGGLDLTAGGRGAKNVLDGLDFDRLDQLTEEQDVLALNDYFASLEGTAIHSRTGLFRDYNLIVICAEAFSPYVIDPELTPTLYRMSGEGIVFKNFYNSFPNLTTNGEYSLCMGLMPDLRRMSFATSVNNYAPFCLGAEFTAAGRTALAYHNNIGTFYNRVNTHANMGYDFRAIDFGLDMEVGNPTSDLELMEKTIDDYIDREPFHAYYMTYSGHADYGFEENDMSRKNLAKVRGVEGSEALRAYVACQLELERAVTYLLERLEETGLDERTVVVLTGDHMPYGLPEKDYAQLAGEATAEPFWQYRSSFICWTGGMEEPIVVEDYCCTQDILPTLLNLFGLAYDSRLLTGRDVLADCTHMALLEDGSFLTEDMLYDGSSGEVVWRTEPDEAYAQALIQAADNQFAVSAAILATDYYGFALPALGLSTGPADRVHHASYADIADKWYEEDVELLTAHGALTGGAEGDFQGERPITRAALLAMVTRALQLPRGEGEPPYTDLEEGKWYMETIVSAWAAGLLSGEETELRPDEFATLSEAEALLTAAAAYAGLEDGASWAEAELERVRLAQEEEAGAPLPGERLSRGACAAAVAALLRQPLEGHGE